MEKCQEPECRLEKIIKDMVELYKVYAEEDGTLQKQKIEEMMEKETGCCELKDIQHKLKQGGKDFQRRKGQGEHKHKCDGNMEFRQFARCVACMAKRYYRKTHGGEDSCEEDEA